MATDALNRAVLDFYLEKLIARISSIFVFVRRKKVDDNLLEKLQEKLISVNGVLNDAQKKQIGDQKVRRRLEDLEDVILDAEDLVDEINTEALRREFEEAGRSTGSRRLSLLLFQVRKFFSDRFIAKELETRMEKILRTADDIHKEILPLTERVVEGKAYDYPRGPSETALVKGSDVHGRDADKTAIADLLLSDDNEVRGDHNISVVAIVAMCGMDKTALAQRVFHDIDREAELRSKKPFDCKVWITVSEEFDVFNLTKGIYEQVPSPPPKRTFKERFQLQGELEKILAGQKFLLVLDDVWNKDYLKWYEFKTPFESIERGSKILVTTRDGDIASKTGVPYRSYQLGQISVEHGRQLFAKLAFANINPSARLEEIGSLIVDKCRGLPLAIRNYAGLCSGTENSTTWTTILNSHIWELMFERGCKILPALWLSYYYLPPHLRRCFAYCSVFPKDYKIQKEQLILLWMAQDLLQPQNPMTSSLEEVGEQYIKDLTSMSLFHDEGYDSVTMHDSMNDLAKFISGKSCLRSDDRDYSDGLMRKTRHFSGLIQTAQDIEKFKDVPKSKVLRTLLELGGNRIVRECDLIQPQELQSMQYLRVFSLSGWLLACTEPLGTQLLDSIGSLKLLRYLDFSGTGIKEIPLSICTLYNLQTLLLKSSYALTGLPDSIGNLRNLRHLDLRYCTSFEHMPETLCDLHELRTLRLVGCSNLSRLPSNIKALISLRHLSISRTSIKEMPEQMFKLKIL